MDRSDDVLLRRKFGETIPSVTELSKQISLMFVNTHYSLSGPKPLPPTVVELGGVHIKEPKAIDEVSGNSQVITLHIHNIATGCGSTSTPRQT